MGGLLLVEDGLLMEDWMFMASQGMDRYSVVSNKGDTAELHGRVGCRRFGSDIGVGGERQCG